MNNLFKILTLILAVLLCLSLIFSKELSIEKAIRERENIAIKKQRDSLETQINVIRDSLTVAFELIRLTHNNTAEAHRSTEKTRRNHERIIFINHTDAGRDSLLTILYPSFRPVR